MTDHPAWCQPEHCNAYGQADNPIHRSTPTVIPTEDHGVEIYVYLAADDDGRDTYIEIAELDIEDLHTGPWHTAQPRFGLPMALPPPQAAQLSQAISHQLDLPADE